MFDRIVRTDNHSQPIKREHVLIPRGEGVNAETVVKRVGLLLFQLPGRHADLGLSLDETFRGRSRAVRLEVDNRFRLRAGADRDLRLLRPDQFGQRRRAIFFARIGLDEHWHQPLADGVGAMHAEARNIVQRWRRRRNTGAGFDIHPANIGGGIFQRRRGARNLEKEFSVVRFETLDADPRSVGEAENRRRALRRQGRGGAYKSKTCE